MNKTEKSHRGDHNTLWTLKILDFNYFTDNTLWNFEYHRFSNTWVLTIGRLGAMEIFIVWSLLVDVNTYNFLQKKATKNSSPVIYPPYPTFSVVHINIYIFICSTTQETLSAHASARRSSGRWNNKFCCRHKIHTTSDYVQNAQKPTFLLCCGTSFRHVSTKRLRFEVVDVAWQLLLLVLVMLMLRDIPLNSFWGRSGKLLDTDFLKFQESSGDFVS